MNICRQFILGSLVVLGSMSGHFLHAQEAELKAEIVKAADEETTEKTTTTTTTTKTVITETVVKEKPAWTKLKVCVMDFSTIDTVGQKRFLDIRNKPLEIPAQCTLNGEDRQSVNGIMQGFVRLIDAYDNTRTNKGNREGQAADNAFTRDKALDIYVKTLEGQARPSVIGADYLAAYLGRHQDVFACLDRNLVGAAMNKIRQQADFPQDFMLKVARMTGATHLICGTVSDIRTRENHFKGYGIETQTLNYDLDVIIKVVDLVAQHTVYSNVYTGSYTERRPLNTAQFDQTVFQSLMTAALQQASDELYEICKPGDGNRIAPIPLPKND